MSPSTTLARPNLLVLGLLPVALGAERFAYYGTRSVLVAFLRNTEGLPSNAAYEVSRHMLYMGLVATVLGGLLALAINARITAVVGAGLAFLGYALLASGVASSLATLTIALGSGVFRPCIWAIAAEEVSRESVPLGAQHAPKSPRRFAAMAALSLGLYATINVVALSAPWMAKKIAAGLGHSYALALSSMVMLVCIAAAAALVFVGRAARTSEAAAGGDPYRAAAAPVAAAPARSRPDSGLGIAGLALLLLAEIPFSMAASATSFSSFQRGLSSDDLEWIYTVNPVVVMLTALAFAALFLVATLRRWSLPPLVFYAVALPIFAVGLVPLALAERTGSVGLFLAGTVVTAAVEPALSAIGTAYAALAADARRAPLVIGVWFFLTYGASFYVSARGGGHGIVLPATLALVLLAVGVLGIAFARTVHKTLFDADA